MNRIAWLLLCVIALSPMAVAKDDQHECQAALEKLKSSGESDFTASGHHEHQQAKEAHESGDYKKCADQANKAVEHLKKP